MDVLPTGSVSGCIQSKIFLLAREFTDAEILRTNLASVILRMMELKLGDIRQFPFIDSPDPKMIRDGYRLLNDLAAIDPKQRLTKIGRSMARLPIDPKLARILIDARARNCLDEVLVIVSGLAVQDPRSDRQISALRRISSTLGLIILDPTS